MGDTAAALRYAEALYELAKEAGRTDQVLSDLAELKRALMRDADGFGRLMHPRVSVSDKEALLTERFLSGCDPLISKTLRLMVRKRRESLLDSFFRGYLEVHDQHQGILRATVESAAPLADSAFEDLGARLSAATQKEVQLEARVDPGLLGGLRLQLGSRLLDGSVRRRLERIERGLLQAPLNQN